MIRRYINLLCLVTGASAFCLAGVRMTDAYIRDDHYQWSIGLLYLLVGNLFVLQIKTKGDVKEIAMESKKDE